MDEPEVIIGKLLKAKGWRVAAAESCTGGLVGHRLTNVAGSSDYYVGSVTAYANEAKMRVLGVRAETLEAHGAVSAETVVEMSEGVCKALGAELGIAISGIAGPGGGSAEKPVGTVWFGVTGPQGTRTRKFQFNGDRIAVKEQAAETALQLGIDYLNGDLG